MGLEGHEINDTNWDYIRSLGLRSDILTKEDYLKETDAGLRRARNLLNICPDKAWTPSGIGEVHRQILITAYAPSSNVAGEFTKQQLVLYGPNGEMLRGGKPHELQSRLQDLCESLQDQFRAGSPERKIQASIEFHARLKALQAFPDANGRTSSVLLNRHLSVALGRDISLNLGVEAYHPALWTAIKDENYIPLEKVMKDELWQIQSANPDPREIWTTSEVERAMMHQTELKLDKGDILKLDEKAVKVLVNDTQIGTLNGLSRRSLQREFAERGNAERLGAEEVKHLLLETLEQDSRHSDSVRLREHDLLTTRVLKPKF